MKKIVAFFLTALTLLQWIPFAAQAKEPVCYYYDDFTTAYEQQDTKVKSLSHTFPAGSANVERYTDENGKGYMRLLPNGSAGSQLSVWLKDVPGKPKMVVEYKMKAFLDSGSSYVSWSPSNGEPTCHIQRGENNGFYNKANDQKLATFTMEDRKNWHTITIVYDNASPNRTIYLNGEEKGTFEGNNYYQTGDLRFNIVAVMNATSYVDFDYIKIYEYTDGFQPISKDSFQPTFTENVPAQEESTAPRGGTAAEKVGPSFGNKEDLGIGVKTAKTTYSAYGYDKNGNPELYFGVQGCTFYAINALTGKVNFSQRIDSMTLVNGLDVAPDGKVYFVGNPKGVLMCYDPKQEKITECPNFTPVKDAYTLRVSNDNKVYISSFSKGGGYVSEYDVNKAAYRNLGVMKSEAQYNQGMTVTDKYVYVGTGVNADIQAIIRYDRQTGQKQEIKRQLGGSTIYMLSVVDGKLFAMQWGTLMVFDEETLELLDTIKCTGKQYVMSKPSPYDSDLIYYTKDVDIYSYRISTKENEKICTIDAPVDRPLIGLYWVKMPDGSHRLAMNSDFVENVYLLNPQDKTVETVPVTGLEPDGPTIQRMQCADDGMLYIGGYQYGISGYDTNKGEFTFNIQNFHQPEGFVMMNGKAYYGTYTGAVIYRYDPAQPIDYKRDLSTEGNPCMVADIGEMQDRPFVMETAWENTILIGSIPDYGELGGAITVYHEDENGKPDFKTYRNLFPNHAIGGLAYKDGKIYVGTTISGGIGIDPVESQAKFAVIDAKTMAIEKETILNIPGIGTSTAIIGQMSFGPDGLLWACSDKQGTVFGIDTETLEVKKSISTTESDMPATRRGNYIRWGADGTMYTNAGYVLSAVDIYNNTYKNLAKNCTHVAVDPSGNVYYDDKTHIIKLEVSQWERLQSLIARAERDKPSDPGAQQALSAAKAVKQTDSSEAIKGAAQKLAGYLDTAVKTDVPPVSSGISVKIDGEEVGFDDTYGKPFLYEDSRVMLPFRKLFERFGWTVNWDDALQTITAYGPEGDDMKMTIGSNTYECNGVKTEFDVSPLLKEDRTYIPVRVIAESMGYVVGWEDASQTVTITTK